MDPLSPGMPEHLRARVACSEDGRLTPAWQRRDPQWWQVAAREGSIGDNGPRLSHHERGRRQRDRRRRVAS